MDLPQSLMEPIFIKWATGKGWKVRFDTELIGFVDEEHGVADKEEKDGDDNEMKILATVVDNVSGLEYRFARDTFLAQTVAGVVFPNNSTFLSQLSLGVGTRRMSCFALT
jgi:hypothetical protein